jgi:hypothetical protein
MGLALVAEFGKDLQHFALKGVVRAHYANVQREVSGGGSVL